MICVSRKHTGREATARGVVSANRWAVRCLLGIVLVWSGAAESEPVLTTAIAPQPLAAALAEFAHQTGLQMVYVSQIVLGRTCKGARAELSATAALTELLDGTGLSFQF